MKLKIARILFRSGAVVLVGLYFVFCFPVVHVMDWLTKERP